MKNIVVCFPWGAGGNFLRNVFSLSPGYLLHNQHGHVVSDNDKYQLLADYYNTEVTPAGWLEREWTLRKFIDLHYCFDEAPKYCAEKHYIAWPSHCEHRQLEKLWHDRKMPLIADTGSVDRERTQKPTVVGMSDTTLHNYHYVFIYSTDPHVITKVYQSKNPALDQFAQDDELEARFLLAQEVNLKQLQNIYMLRKHLADNSKTVHTIAPEIMLTDEGSHAIIKLATRLDLNIPSDQIKELHGMWLAATRKCYKQYHKIGL